MKREPAHFARRWWEAVGLWCLARAGWEVSCYFEQEGVLDLVRNPL